MRLKRKTEHIENYLKSYHKGDTLFSNIYIENNSLPEIGLKDIDTEVEFIGKKIGFPLMINAMTGGGEEQADINEDLARLAKRFNIPIAVGSQTIGIEDDNCTPSFEIVREVVGPEGIVIGNLSANSTLEYFEKASTMINANAIQLHLNVAQELLMTEGDRDFKGIIDNISCLLKQSSKPIIVKEVGFGISKSAAIKLKNIGVKYIDIGGYGGTNFIEIEDTRSFSHDYSDIYEWGIPTAKSLIDCCEVAKDDIFVVSSGGIRTAQDIIKSLILGAKLTAISGELLQYLMHGGYIAAEEFLESLIFKTKILMVLLGKKNIEELRTVDYAVTGYLKEIINPI